MAYELKQWEITEDGEGIFHGDYYIETADLVDDLDWIPHLAEKSWTDLRDFCIAMTRAFRACGYELKDAHYKAMWKGLDIKSGDIMYAITMDRWMHERRPDLLNATLFMVDDLKSEDEMLAELSK